MALFLTRKYWLLIVLFSIATLACAAWTWVMIDPNFTLYDHADWAVFRERMIAIGLFNRPLSSQLYLTCMGLLTVLHLLIVRKVPALSLKQVTIFAIIIGVIAGICSYPALSRDLFNYIFDAKIFTFYGKNPYLLRAMDFPIDENLRFMHWIHRTYPYGPVYLLISFIPSFLSMGKFSLAFFLFKGMHVGLYALSVWCIYKIKPAAAIFFATAPLVLIEGLMSTHNDFVAVTLGITGMYCIHRGHLWRAFIFMIVSGLIKYFTLPLVVIPSGLLIGKYILTSPQLSNTKLKMLSKIFAQKNLFYYALFGIVGLIMYVVHSGELHSWYILNLFVFTPFLYELLKLWQIFFTSLLLSYYPYVVGGEWGQGGDVGFKKQIMLIGFCINLMLISIVALYKLSHARDQHLR
jgi:hypothetical protein